MKKKFVCLLLASVLLCAFCVSCLRENTLSPAEPSEGIGSSAGAGLSASAGASEKSEKAEKAEKEEKIDVDLTKMSATMVYSEVYNMLALPDDYLGQTVRMKGEFQCYEGEERNYYVVLIADAMACCQQGMEFVLAGDYSFPEDYPEPGTTVTVTGVFDTYTEGEYMRFAQLIDARMTY
jgi:hypothetical protein